MIAPPLTLRYRVAVPTSRDEPRWHPWVEIMDYATEAEARAAIMREQAPAIVTDAERPGRFEFNDAALGLVR